MKYLREYFNFLLLNSFIREILKRQFYKKSLDGAGNEKYVPLENRDATLINYSKLNSSNKILITQTDFKYQSDIINETSSRRNSSNWKLAEQPWRRPGLLSARLMLVFNISHTIAVVRENFVWKLVGPVSSRTSCLKSIKDYFVLGKLSSQH